MELGMWVVMGTSTTHVVCRHQMRIFNTSFAYLFWVANNKTGKYPPEFCMSYSDKLGMWAVISPSTTQVVCLDQMRILITSFASLFSLANNKKGKYPEFCIDHSDETWYVACGGHKYYPPGLWSPNVHI